MARILSGIQPSGRIHLGNYFGMVSRILEHQKSDANEVFVFIANYHSLTTTQDRDTLKKNTVNLILDLVALGVDPAKTIFWVQSDIPEIHELAWVLSTLTPFGILQRGHSFKDKIAKGISSTHALFAYPVLMAADILGVQPDLVPVGPDQAQHLQITRDLVLKLNNSFQTDLKVPEPDLFSVTVPGIDRQKMSKSYNNTIPLFGTDKEVEKQFMRIETDSFAIEEPKTSDTPLVQFYRLLIGEDAFLHEYLGGGVGYGTLKKALYEAFNLKFGEARLKRQEISYSEIQPLLASGAEQARQHYQNTLKIVREAVGLVYSE